MSLRAQRVRPEVAGPMAGSSEAIQNGKKDWIVSSASPPRNDGVCVDYRFCSGVRARD
jgi:hypothetical protein